MPNPLDDRAVYTLDDLQSWEAKRPGLPPSLAVLGHPVAHSVSPQMHNAALAELAKRYPQLKDWRYFKFDISPEDLEKALDLLKEKNFKGVNLTLPHKVDAIKLLNNNVDQDVREVGAVNTLYRTLDGLWRGTITDTVGLQLALFHELGVDLKGKSVLVLGAGGVARSVVVQCITNQCAKLWIGNRTKANLNILLKELEPLHAESRLCAFDLANPPVHEWPDDIVVINATSKELKLGERPPIDVSVLGNAAVIYDTIYQPTQLVADARDRGLRAADGLGMLVWQGASSLSIWLGNSGVHVGALGLAQTMMNAACDALQIPRRAIAS